ncbi:glycosyltransferase family 4 protein [Aeromicrobium sp.]|uniref:glycosyltransferase family 4 protein n=1 Tax=Aeromicrobium sp. TaxID=1871063 RepID=UPI0019870DE9|nr:glycosyltransferase family 4 protein [Aeromicrobium sp.]MBC7631142.1 glycosyltransferase [Aeromicrobium sp.]
MFLTSSRGRSEARRLLSALLTEPSAEASEILLAAAGTSDRHGRHVAAELGRLRRTRPELLLPHVPTLRDSVTAGKQAPLRKHLAAALDCTDPTAVDLDVLVDAALTTDVKAELREVASYVAAHGHRGLATDVSRHPHLPHLVGLIDSAPEDLPRLLSEATLTRDDKIFAFQVALTLKSPPALVALAPHVTADDLSIPQRARAALLLWRAGSNDIAVELARAVPPGTSKPAARARMVTGELESFEMMELGWSLPPRREEPVYTPATGSVLHVLHNSLPYRRTGASNRTQGLLAGLVRHGYDITAVTRPGFPYDEVLGQEAESIQGRHEIQGVVYQHLLNGGVVLPRFPVQEFISTYAAGVIEHAQTESAALIHAASNSYNALSALVAARTLGLPSIYEVRGLYEEVRRSKNEAHADTPQYRFSAYLETMAAMEADQVIAITDGLRDTLVQRGVPADTIHVIPNGVDSQRFQPLPRDADLSERYGLDDKIVIGYIGSLNWYEGHELLFEAFARLHARHSNVRLLIVGAGANLKNLLALRTRLGLEDEIIMPGSVAFEEVEAHYSLIDIAPITRLSSPVTESVSPLKPFEAMAMAKTVISSNVAIMTEVVDDGRTGLLFRKGDASSLEQVLERLVRDADLRAQLGSQARDWVVAERDWEILSGRVAKIYRSLGVDPARPR